MTLNLSLGSTQRRVALTVFACLPALIGPSILGIEIIRQKTELGFTMPSDAAPIALSSFPGVPGVEEQLVRDEALLHSAKQWSRHFDTSPPSRAFARIWDVDTAVANQTKMTIHEQAGKKFVLDYQSIAAAYLFKALLREDLGGGDYLDESHRAVLRGGLDSLGGSGFSFPNKGLWQRNNMDEAISTATSDFPVTWLSLVTQLPIKPGGVPSSLGEKRDTWPSAVARIVRVQIADERKQFLFFRQAGFLAVNGTKDQKQFLVHLLSEQGLLADVVYVMQQKDENQFPDQKRCSGIWGEALLALLDDRGEFRLAVANNMQAQQGGSEQFLSWADRCIGRGFGTDRGKWRIWSLFTRYVNLNLPVLVYGIPAIIGLGLGIVVEEYVFSRGGRVRYQYKGRGAPASGLLGFIFFIPMAIIVWKMIVAIYGLPIAAYHAISLNIGVFGAVLCFALSGVTVMVVIIRDLRSPSAKRH